MDGGGDQVNEGGGIEGVNMEPDIGEDAGDGATEVRVVVTNGEEVERGMERTTAMEPWRYGVE